MNDVGVALLGFGTVGAGVVRGLQRNGDLLARRLGVRPVLRHIADLDLVTDRGVTVDRALLTTDAAAAVDDPAVQVVIELIGGTGAARELVLRALGQGKPVVTANKKLLAEHGREIFEAAREHGTDIGFGASVGGGIPVIRALREGLVANRIESIHGILNGTCNYILTCMERDGRSFDEVLAEAQARGYAEADPSLDVDGFDTAHKAVLLASLAYGGYVPMDAVTVEGIRGVTAADVAAARSLGYAVKLLAVIRRTGDGPVEVRVHPALVPAGGLLASVNGVFNAIVIRGDLTGDTLYYGRGAGGDPTAGTVLGDVADVVRNLARDAAHRVPAVAVTPAALTVQPIEDVCTRSYLRFTLRDRAGTLSAITGRLAQHGISLVSVVQQQGVSDGTAPVVMVTHEAPERVMRQALADAGTLEGVAGAPVRIRIEA